MIVYATSDLHGQLPDIPSDADLLCVAGDICPDFRPMKGNHYDFVDKIGSQQADWLSTEFRDWALSAPCPVVCTWGNHDFVGESHLLHQHVWTPPLYMLHDSLYTTTGQIFIYGTPWVPGLPYWAFYGSDVALKARAEAIPACTELLMVHGPPYGAGDFIPGGTPKQVSKYGNRDGMRVGDKWLNAAIERIKPRAVICGHIHEDRGVHEVAGVPVYNVAAVDENYVLRSKPWVRLHEFDDH